MSRTYQLESGSVEVIPIEVKTAADPTGAAVSFSFTASTATDAGSFTAGSWSGTYDTDTDIAIALTPTCGAATATIDLTSASKWRLWITYTIGSETVIRPVGIVTVG